MTTITPGMAIKTIQSPGKKTEEFLSRVAVVSRPTIQTQPSIKPVTEPTKETEPELIPPSAYWADIKARWKLVKKELKDLVKDIKKAIEFSKPYVTKAIDKTKELIKSAKTWIEKTQSKNEKDHTG